MSDNTEFTPIEKPETDFIGAVAMFEHLSKESQDQILEMMHELLNE